MKTCIYIYTCTIHTHLESQWPRIMSYFQRILGYFGVEWPLVLGFPGRSYSTLQRDIKTATARKQVRCRCLQPSWSRWNMIFERAMRNGPKLLKMVQNCPKWSKRSKIASNGQFPYTAHVLSTSGWLQTSARGQAAIQRTATKYVRLRPRWPTML